MSLWTKRQRIESIINGELADRLPISALRHFTNSEKNPIVKATVFIADLDIAKEFNDVYYSLLIVKKNPIVNPKKIQYLYYRKSRIKKIEIIEKIENHFIELNKLIHCNLEIGFIKYKLCNLVYERIIYIVDEV